MHYPQPEFTTIDEDLSPLGIGIYGASGANGTLAVQIAKNYGAVVDGVCSTNNLELVKSLEADSVYDYTSKDFKLTKQKYDIIFDAVGKKLVL